MGNTPRGTSITKGDIMTSKPSTADLKQYRNEKGPAAGAQAKKLYIAYAIDRIHSMTKTEARAWLDSWGHYCEVAALMRNRRGPYSTVDRANIEVRVNMGLGAVKMLRDIADIIEQEFKSM